MVDRPSAGILMRWRRATMRGLTLVIDGLMCGVCENDRFLRCISRLTILHTFLTYSTVIDTLVENIREHWKKDGITWGKSRCHAKAGKREGRWVTITDFLRCMSRLTLYKKFLRHSWFVHCKIIYKLLCKRMTENIKKCRNYVRKAELSRIEDTSALNMFEFSVKARGTVECSTYCADSVRHWPKNLRERRRTILAPQKRKQRRLL